MFELYFGLNGALPLAYIYIKEADLFKKKKKKNKGVG